jgi:hypothetical protein
MDRCGRSVGVGKQMRVPLVAATFFLHIKFDVEVGELALGRVDPE